MRPIESLLEHPLNANKHPERQLKYLAKILAHQGWRHPITVSKRSGYIVAGHGRLLAAKMNGWTEAPVDLQEFDSEADEYAHLIADNKIAELAEHDDAFMQETIKNSFAEIDLDLLALADISFMIPEDNALDEKPEVSDQKKYQLQITFPNDMEMMQIHDECLNRGFLVKIL